MFCVIRKIVFIFAAGNDKSHITMSEINQTINLHVSVDCVLIGFDGEQFRVLLVRQVGKQSEDGYNNMKLPGSLIYDDEDLDEAAKRVLGHFKEMTETGAGVLLITHDLGIVAQMVDKVAIVYAGEIVETGSAEDIFDRPAHPYTTGLFNALPSLADDQTRLTPIHGLVPDPTALPKGCKFHTRCPYASEACEKAVPPLKETEPGHYTRCSRGRKEAT